MKSFGESLNCSNLVSDSSVNEILTCFNLANANIIAHDKTMGSRKGKGETCSFKHVNKTVSSLLTLS